MAVQAALANSSSTPTGESVAGGAVKKIMGALGLGGGGGAGLGIGASSSSTSGATSGNAAQSGSGTGEDFGVNFGHGVTQGGGASSWIYAAALAAGALFVLRMKKG